MAQTKEPEVLFEQQNIHVLLEEENDSKTYLTEVTIFTPVNFKGFWGSEMDEKEFEERNIEFTMVYRYTTATPIDRVGMVRVAYFSKDIVDYQIYEAKFLEGWNWREFEDHPWQSMSFEASKGKCTYIGNSDNEELFSVKVWKYVKNINTNDSLDS